MEPHEFKASPDEIEFAEWIRRKTLRKSTGPFSRDAAIRMLKESGFSFKQIREIWTIVDRDGDGKLCKEELCALVRLAGWVQQLDSDAEVSESLLAQEGPLPTLKGISCIPRNDKNYFQERRLTGCLPRQRVVRALPDKPSAPRQASHEEHRQAVPEHIYAPLTVVHRQICSCLFESVKTVNGLMDREIAAEILTKHFGPPPSGILNMILDLVRTTHLFTLDILEFTLAAYFLVELRNGTIKSLPTEIPKELCDQFRTSMPPSYPHVDVSSELKERKTDSVASVNERPASNAHKSVAAFRAPSAHQGQHAFFPARCPSISSVETKKISKLWERVAEKVLKLSSTRSKSTQRDSISSDISTNGTIQTEFSLSSAGNRSDTFFHPEIGHKVTTGATHLPLVYRSKAGYYVSPGPALPIDIPSSIGGDGYASDDVVLRSPSTAQYNESPSEGTTTARSSLLSDGSTQEVEMATEKVRVEREAEVGIREIFDMLAGMKEECVSLKRQMQIMQETIQQRERNRLSTARSVRFAKGGTCIGQEGHAANAIVPDSVMHKRSESPKLTKEPTGPRKMFPSNARIRTCGDDHHCRREISVRVQGYRRKFRDSDSSSASSSASVHETVTTPTRLRSILKVKVDESPTREESKSIIHDGLAIPEMKSDTTTATVMQHGHKRAARRFGVSEEMPQTWNAWSIPSDGILMQGGPTLSTTKDEEVRRPPRRLPAAGEGGVQLRGPVPTSSAKYPGGYAKDWKGASSARRASTITGTIYSYQPDGRLSTKPSFVVMNEPSASTLSDSSSSESPPDIRRTSAYTTPLSYTDRDTARTSRSTASQSSLFSHRRQSARTTLLTEIDEYNDTVLNDLQEAAPEWMQQVRKSVLRDLHTNIGRPVTNIVDQAVDCERESNTQAAPPSYSQVIEELEHGSIRPVREGEETPNPARRPCGCPLSAGNSGEFVCVLRQGGAIISEKPSRARPTRHADSELVHIAFGTKVKMAKIFRSIPKISETLTDYFVNIAKPRQDTTVYPFYVSRLYDPDTRSLLG